MAMNFIVAGPGEPKDRAGEEAAAAETAEVARDARRGADDSSFPKRLLLVAIVGSEIISLIA
jgi:hypothetical protein